MERYLMKEGKRLRLGYTTGSCAAAAAKGAAWMLLTGSRKEQISLVTPKGLPLTLPLLDIAREPGRVSCAVEKDSGDDPDVTNGARIVAAVSYSAAPGIAIEGGSGVGRVTKRGLDQPVGAAAINSVPRQMIQKELEEVCRLTDYGGGLSVVLSVPQGEALAQKTFNPRLGIIGGISILGTTGIVEPMSEAALVETIRVELRQRRAMGAQTALLTPGNYGSDFIRQGLGLDPALAVQTSNFIGEALDLCKELGFQRALLVGHIGKLVKCAGGMLNTHSKYGDCRLEILGAHAAACGLPSQRVEELLSCATCDDGLRILGLHGLTRPVMARIVGQAHLHVGRRGAPMETAVALFSKEYGLLGQSPNWAALFETLTTEG